MERRLQNMFSSLLTGCNPSCWSLKPINTIAFFTTLILICPFGLKGLREKGGKENV
jgi:hypothetical protein